MGTAVETASEDLKQAWADYHAMLEEARLALEATPRFQQMPRYRAKAYHILMEMQAMAYNLAVAPRLAHPRIFVNLSWQTEVYTLGHNCQDFLYGIALVDGRQTYRLHGRMGDLSLFVLQVLDGMPGEKDVKATGNYDWADFEIDAEGRFEVVLSATEQPGNWIRLNPDADLQLLFMRRALPDWHGDRGELHLDPVGEIAASRVEAEEFDEAVMAARIRRATAFARNYLLESLTLSLYDQYLKNAGGRKNVLSLLPGTTTNQTGSQSSNYAMGVFELKEDEVLLLEMDRVPDGVYWSFQTGDVWSRSVDFTHRQSSLNNLEAIPDSDGKLRIVVAASDPGVHNWLDTCDRSEGVVVFRNYRAQSAPVPTSRTLKRAELDAWLPRDTRRISMEERRKLLDRRRLGQLKFYGE